MLTHLGDFYVPLCGTAAKLPLDVDYTYDDRENGPEIHKITATIDLDRIVLEDWPDQLVDAIRAEIVKEHRYDDVGEEDDRA